MSQDNNFVPNQEDYKPLTPFQLFVKSNFPFIENTFEALDNYGLYCKIVEYLNTVIENENTVESNVSDLYDAFISLNNYVSDYFDNLDVQDEINKKLDEMTENGTLTNIIGGYVNYQIIPLINEQNQNIQNFENETTNSVVEINSKVNSLNTGAPAGVYDTVASLTSDNPDHTKIYVVTADGKWYYYNNTSSNWVAGGVYQSAGVGLGEIKPENLDSLLLNQYKADATLFNIDKKFIYLDVSKYGYGQYGTDATPQNRIALKRLDFFPIEGLSKIKIVPSGDYQIALFLSVTQSYSTASDNLILDSGWIAQERTIDFSDYPDANYIGIRLRKEDNSVIDMTIWPDIEFKIFTDLGYSNEDVDVSKLEEIFNISQPDLETIEDIIMTNPTTKNFKAPILNINHPVLVAHRGYSAIAPENTIPAFEEARKGRFLGL